MKTLPRHNKNILTLVNYAKRKYKTNTIFSGNHDTEYEPKNNTIYINTKLNKQIQLYYYLHELGHCIMINKDREQYIKSYPLAYDVQDYNKRTNRKQRVDVIREEVLAWDIGYQMAIKLKIPINIKHYQHYVRRNLYSYIEWCVNPNPKQKETKSNKGKAREA